MRMTIRRAFVPGGFAFPPQGVPHGANEAFRAKLQVEPQFGFVHCARGA
jgi:hypothetical protein